MPHQPKFIQRNPLLKLSNASAHPYSTTIRQNMCESPEFYPEESLPSCLKSTSCTRPEPSRSQSDPKMVRFNLPTDSRKAKSSSNLVVKKKSTSSTLQQVKKSLKISSQIFATHNTDMQDKDSFVSAVHTTEVEEQIREKMIDIATSKAKEGLWEESYFILKSVLSYEEKSLGDDHPQVANTLYHMSVALQHLGDSEGALSCLQEGVKILFPRRHKVKNADLAALFYQCGVIKGKSRDYTGAIYYLDLSKQVEIHIFGQCSAKTNNLLLNYQNMRKTSRIKTLVRSKAA